MEREPESPPEQPSPTDEFGFTEREQLYARITHKRLLALLADPQTVVHGMHEDHNAFGEFVFLKVSRPGRAQRIWVTFWGLGYHEYRERWLVDEWFYHHSNALPGDDEQVLEKEEVNRLLAERHRLLRAAARQSTQSPRGRLFEMLADLTDEDGAYADLQDLEDLAGWWEEDSG